MPNISEVFEVVLSGALQPFEWFTQLLGDWQFLILGLLLSIVLMRNIIAPLFGSTFNSGSDRSHSYRSEQEVE